MKSSERLASFVAETLINRARVSVFISTWLSPGFSKSDLEKSAISLEELSVSSSETETVNLLGKPNPEPIPLKSS